LYASSRANRLPSFRPEFFRGRADALPRGVSFSIGDALHLIEPRDGVSNMRRGFFVLLRTSASNSCFGKANADYAGTDTSGMWWTS
jgi:hypothetical protein